MPGGAQGLTQANQAQIRQINAHQSQQIHFLAGHLLAGCENDGVKDGNGHKNRYDPDITDAADQSIRFDDLVQTIIGAVCPDPGDQTEQDKKDRQKAPGWQHQPPESLLQISQVTDRFIFPAQIKRGAHQQSH